YWYRNLRQTVRFGEGAEALLRDGHRFFVEVSPHPVLTLALEETAAASQGASLATGSLRRGEGGLERLMASWSELWARGCPMRFDRVLEPGRSITLPTYAFDRQRYWLNGVKKKGDVSSLGQSPVDHPLLGAALSVAGGEDTLLTGTLSIAAQ